MNHDHTTAVQELFRSKAGLIEAHLIEKTGDPEVAADLTQRAFERLLHRTTARHYPALLGRIVHGLLVEHWIAKATTPERLMGLMNVDEEYPIAKTTTLDSHDFTAKFDTALRRLPGEERDAFILTELRGLTVRDAAPILGISKSEVFNRAESAAFLIRKELTT